MQRMVAIHFLHYNFTRIYKTLRIMPAIWRTLGLPRKNELFRL
jgi:hypothetical protein